MGTARFAHHSANSLDALSLSSTVRAAGRSQLRWLCAWMPLVALAGGGLNLARAQVTPIPTWTQQSPGTSPPARIGGGMAYDDATGQVVLFGGFSPTFGDTWTWNGTNWTQQSPANSPSARSNTAMAYDAATGQVVLFGGIDNSGNFLNDTWTWDGTNWTEQSPGTSPPVRFDASMAYDTATGQMVLFGGQVDNNILNDTWTWDGTNWTQLNPATSPSARGNASMAYDAASGQVVLFGGAGQGAAPFFLPTFLNDTWAWNGTNWTQLSPATSPSARSNTAMAYDAASDQVVLFGGTRGPDETWTWDGTNWTQQSPATSPPERSSAMMAYDAASGRVVLFGGQGDLGVLADTWTLNVGATSLGSANECFGGATTPSPCSQSTTVSFDVAANTTIGSINILTQGAAGLDFVATPSDTSTTLCTAQTYTTETVCTVDVTFGPKKAGARYGGVVIKDGSGNVLANTYVFGTANAPQLTFLPGTLSTLSSLGSNGGFGGSFGGVAVDGSSNVYVSAKTTSLFSPNSVQEISSGAITTLGSGGFFQPVGVAVDGSGNVYVVDDGNPPAVKEMPPGCLSSSCVTTLAGGFSLASFPVGVAVDGSGNVYVADDIFGVREIPPGCTSSSCVATLGGGFTGPEGVAVDSSSNVYVADTGNNAVKEIPSGCFSSSCVATLGGGFTGPGGVAVDGGGNVYVADTGNNMMKEIPPGCASSSCVSTLVGGLPNGARLADGVAVDGSGNVYVADPAGVHELNVTAPPSLTFAATDFGSQSSDSPMTVTLRNIGNEPLAFPVPAMGTNPSIPSSFTLDSSITCPQVSSSSPSGGMLNAGASCALPFDFIPAAIGDINGSAVLTDNNLNQSGAMQTIMLSGMGNQIPQSITFTSPGTGNQAFGTTTMASATGGGSGNAVRISSLTPLVCTVTGGTAASPTTVSLIGPGTCTLAANQSGSTDYSAAPQATQSFTVTQATQTITFNNPGSQVQGGTLNLMATASSGLTVSFASNTTLVCTVPVGATTASLIAPGQCSITASQAGNTDFAAATPVVQTFTVTPVFVLTVAPTTTTASRPGNEPVVLKLTPVSGFKGPVTLSCILPAGVASGTKCPGLPDTATLNGTSTVSYSTGVLFPNTTKAGTYVVTFTAVDGKFNDSTTATFIVK